MTRGAKALCCASRQAQRRLAWAAAAWAGALGHWLAWAYALEHAGWSVYVCVWAASLAFLGAQAALLCALLAAQAGGARPRSGGGAAADGPGWLSSPRAQRCCAAPC